ncbi:MAG: TetR/AcrR family transcriptional regulator [Coriobacteriia bacterium]
MTLPSVIVASADYDLRMTVLSAVDRLLEETSLDKLTVTAICDAANVSRAAFYRKFQDKYAVCQWHLDFLYHVYLDEIGRSLTLHEGHLGMLKAVANHRTFYCHMAQTIDRENWFADYTLKRRSAVLTETLTRYKRIPMDDALEYYVLATAAMETSMVLEWMRRGMPQAPERMAKLIVDAVPRMLAQLLDSPSPKLD